MSQPSSALLEREVDMENRSKYPHTRRSCSQHYERDDGEVSAEYLAALKAAVSQDVARSVKSSLLPDPIPYVLRLPATGL